MVELSGRYDAQADNYSEKHASSALRLSEYFGSNDDWNHSLATRLASSERYIPQAKVSEDGMALEIAAFLKGHNIEDLPMMGGTQGIDGFRKDKPIPVEINSINPTESTPEDNKRTDNKIASMLGFFTWGVANFDAKDGKQLWIDNKETDIALKAWNALKTNYPEEFQLMHDYLRKVPLDPSRKPKMLVDLEKELHEKFLPYEMIRPTV